VEGPAVAIRCGTVVWGCASIGVEVGFERHSKDWPACRSNENILPTPLTRVAGGWHDVLVLAMRGSYRTSGWQSAKGAILPAACSGEGHKGES